MYIFLIAYIIFWIYIMANWGVGVFTFLGGLIILGVIIYGITKADIYLAEKYDKQKRKNK